MERLHESRIEVFQAPQLLSLSYFFEVLKNTPDLYQTLTLVTAMTTPVIATTNSMIAPGDNHLQVTSEESKLLQQPFKLIAPSSLSPRELEVLKLLVEGHTNSAIATTLYLSPNTIKTHVRSMMKKLGANSRIQIAVMAVRYGIV